MQNPEKPRGAKVDVSDGTVERKNEKQSEGGEEKQGNRGDRIEPEFQKHDPAEESVRSGVKTENPGKRGRDQTSIQEEREKQYSRKANKYNRNTEFKGIVHHFVPNLRDFPYSAEHKQE